MAVLCQLLFGTGHAAAVVAGADEPRPICVYDAVEYYYDGCAAISHSASAALVVSLANGERERSAAWPQERSLRGSSASVDVFVAPRGAGLADDAIAAADDAFAHGYRYDPRIRARGLQDPTGHNFPYSFDDVILRSTPIRQADGSLLYRAPGSIWGKDGFFEIAVNTDTGTIFHRTYVGG